MRQHRELRIKLRSQIIQSADRAPLARNHLNGCKGERASGKQPRHSSFDRSLCGVAGDEPNRTQ
jgi:hypothetical protein